MSGQHLLQFAMFVLGAGLAVRVISVILASIYDVIAARDRYQKSKTARAGTARVQYIVIAKNHQSTVVNCLESIRATRPSLPIIVVALPSTDDTVELIKEAAARKRSKIRLTLIQKRTTISNEACVKEAAKRSKADLLIVVDAGMTVPKTLTKSLRRAHVAHPQKVLRGRLVPTPSLHLLGRLQSIQVSLAELISRSRLTRTVNPLEVPGYAVPKTLLKSRGPAEVPVPAVLRYTPAETTSAYRLFIQSRPAYQSKLLRTAQIVELATLAIGTIYALFMALSFVTPAPLLFLASVAAMWLWLGVWSSDAWPITQKLSTSYYLPALLLVLPFVGIYTCIAELWHPQYS